MPTSDRKDQQQHDARVRLAGEIFGEVLADAGHTPTSASREWDMARSVINEYKAGQKSNAVMFAKLAVRLGLPPRFFRAIIEGNVDELQVMEGKALTDDLRLSVMKRLATLDTPAPAAKRTRRSG